MVLVGRTAYVILGNNRLARIEFVTLDIAERYEAIRVTILNTGEGEIDQSEFRFRDFFTPVPLGNGDNKEVPYIWTYREKTEWYVKPNKADYSKLSSDIHRYILLFA